MIVKEKKNEAKYLGSEGVVNNKLYAYKPAQEYC
jgi:hypothetical protein